MTIILPVYTGPGPTRLLGQYTERNDCTKQHGFFGEISAAEFITGDTLASAIGLKAGVEMNNNVFWLKFYIDGKIVFVPKRPLRTRVSWKDIYQTGAVYGDGTTGLHPAGKPRKQDATVKINKDTFKVMLISGANSNPATIETGNDSINTHNSEWNRLFYNIYSDRHNGCEKRSQKGGQWWSNSDEELGIDYYHNSGSFSWCIEEHQSNQHFRVIRGGFKISYLGRYVSYFPDSNIGWRPKLELVF